MKSKEELAKYRIKGAPLTKAGLDGLGIPNEHYMVPMNGNRCKVVISKPFGDVHISSCVELTDTLGRLPNYEECLKIKDIFFEEDEIIVLAFHVSL